MCKKSAILYVVTYRGLLQMKKIISATLTVFILTICIFLPAYAAPEVRSGSVILAALNGEQVVFSKNPDEKVPPAEFTKLMSAYTTYRIFGGDVSITVPEDIGEYVNYMETGMDLKAGEQINTSSLIYGMIMGQANDAALAVAFYYGGLEEFTGRMNDYAKELGMTSTVFTNPTGSFDERQYTTATDMLKLYRAFYASKDLYKYVSAKNVTLPATNLSKERTIWTKNHLMSRFIYLDYIYDYADAGLSSSSSKGGYAVISSATKGSKELVCVVMDSVYENGVNYSMLDAKELFDYGFDKFTTVTVAKQGDLMYEAGLKNQRGKDTLLLGAEKTLKGYILDTDVEGSKQSGIDCLEKEIVLNEPVSAPLKKGDVVGKIVYTYNGNLFGELNLVAERDVRRSFFRTIGGWISGFFGSTFFKVLIIIAVCIVGVLFAMSVNSSRKRRRRNRYKRRYKKF